MHRRGPTNLVINGSARRGRTKRAKLKRTRMLRLLRMLRTYGRPRQPGHAPNCGLSRRPQQAQRHDECCGQQQGLSLFLFLFLFLSLSLSFSFFLPSISLLFPLYVCLCLSLSPARALHPLHPLQRQRDCAIQQGVLAWTSSTLVEICVGLEINGYLPAEF
jgi:hypothetical protein